MSFALSSVWLKAGAAASKHTIAHKLQMVGKRENDFIVASIVNPRK
jgi:hypothetical protein